MAPDTAAFLSCARTYSMHLERLIRDEVRNTEELKIYLDALEEMKRTYVLWTDQSPTQWETDDVFVWILAASHEFLELLREQKPVALVIFGFFLSPATPAGMDVVD